MAFEILTEQGQAPQPESPELEPPRKVAPARRERLTELLIARLKPRPDGRQYTVWDAGMQGFGVRVSGQTRTFVVVYRYQGRSRWVSLARSPNVTLNDARRLAQKVFGAVANGGDPAGEKHREHDAVSFKALCERYLTEHAARNKRASSAAEDARRIERDLLPRWDNRPAASVTRAEILRMIEEIAARPAVVSANRCAAAPVCLGGRMFRNSSKTRRRRTR
jgi:hypothetical protein